MKYSKTVILKNQKVCLLKSASGSDAQEVIDNFNLTHAQTDFLLTYPDENNLTLEKECSYLSEKEQSSNTVEICAILDGKVVGTAGIDAVGEKEKIRHRAEFGISIEKEYWGLGIGYALTMACIECARRAGYAQLELDVVGENRHAIALYKKAGFEEYGRNPRGFRSRKTGWQELVLMRKKLDGPDLLG